MAHQFKLRICAGVSIAVLIAGLSYLGWQFLHKIEHSQRDLATVPRATLNQLHSQRTQLYLIEQQLADIRQAQRMLDLAGLKQRQQQMLYRVDNLRLHLSQINDRDPLDEEVFLELTETEQNLQRLGAILNRYRPDDLAGFLAAADATVNELEFNVSFLYGEGSNILLRQANRHTRSLTLMAYGTVVLILLVTLTLIGLIYALRTVFRQKAELHQRSLEDALTGLQNRRSFNELLPRAVQHAQQAGTPLTLLMIDVDHFKAFNDHYGHFAGDKALAKIAETIKQTADQAGNHLFRIGGEEFACLIASHTKADAVRTAEQIRANLEAMAIPHQKNSSSRWVTASLGLAQLPDPRLQNEDALYMAADDALYTAKRNGRNRLVVAAPAKPRQAAQTESTNG